MPQKMGWHRGINRNNAVHLHDFIDAPQHHHEDYGPYDLMRGNRDYGVPVISTGQLHAIKVKMKRSTGSHGETISECEWH
jgi:hypothetical protein